MSMIVNPMQVKTAENMLFLGDSITDGGRYISLLHSYFTLYLPDCPISFRNAGVSSETASGLSEPDHPFPRPCVLSRSRQALSHFQPKWVVVSYGINDGIYYPFENTRLAAYQNGIRVLIEEIHQAGAKAIVLTPPVFDAASFAGELGEEGEEGYSFMRAFQGYTQVMERYADWVMTELPGIADLVVDIYHPLAEGIAECRRADPEFRHGDGIHPGLPGHFQIARVLLGEIFGIEANHFELDMMADGCGYIDRMQVLDDLAHAADREAVPHENPYKSEVLPAKEWQLVSQEKKTELREYAAAHPELFEQFEKWQGFSLRRFHFHGLEALVACPEKAAPGCPWAWRTEFFGAFPAVDLEMLRRGWHVAHLAIPDRFGAPSAVSEMEEFQPYLMDLLGLHRKTVLFGFSRGGLYALHYGARHPERVAAIYLDAPVIDIRSWPGGKGAGEGSPLDWKLCLEQYQLKEETADFYGRIQEEAIERLVQAGIPLALVAGDADTLVPYEENGLLLERAYRKEKLPFRCILKPGVGHHPHSLEEPAPIADFLSEIGTV